MERSKAKAIQVIELGTLDYAMALVRQQQMVDERIKDLCPDCLLMVEHPPVVTIGRGGNQDDLRVSNEALGDRGVALQQVDRGGRATFHGPGQMVVYPIVKVADKDLHRFLKRLIDTMADLLRDYGLVPETKRRQPGVWVNGAKIASVGLAVRKWVTYHGIALNVSTDPGWFDMIIPCGHPDEKITSMETEMGNSVEMAAVKERFINHFVTHHTYGVVEASRSRPGRDPKWLVLPPTDRNAVDRMEKQLTDLQLATVCQSAQCPNQGDCFSKGTATFMIMGTNCTRRCRFCAVNKGAPTPLDAGEPQRIAMAVDLMGLRHAVVTSVTRDDLRDGGAGHFAKTIQRIHDQCPNVSVEVLVPDFGGAVSSVDAVCAAGPEVFNHNIETVPRLYDRIRPRADYGRSLSVLSYAASRGMTAKSGLMLGLGETANEIKTVLGDLKKAHCMRLTIGQYLAPSKAHAPMVRYVPPAEFEMWANTARELGFTSVASGPLVRSSYRAGEMMGEGLNEDGDEYTRKAG